MMILAYIVGLLICFYLLARVCDKAFVPSLEVMSRKLKLSQDVAGASFMAMGSSAPELFTAMIALTKVGSEDVGAGTIVGSAIFNVLVIVGASAVAAKAILRWQPVIRDLVFYIISIILLMVTFRDGEIHMGEALVFVAGYALYILLLSQWSKWYPDPIGRHEEEIKEGDYFGKLGPLNKSFDTLMMKVIPKATDKPRDYIGAFVMSVLVIGALSWTLVELAILIAHALGIPEVIIALTILAGGTSIPDLFSSIIVAKRGRGGMAVSNAVGSNTFDILIGLGFPWLLYILITGKTVAVGTENLFSSVLLLFFTVIALLTLLIVQKFKIAYKSGYLLLVLYAMYFCYALYGAYHPDAFGIEEAVRSLL